MSRVRILSMMAGVAVLGGATFCAVAVYRAHEVLQQSVTANEDREPLSTQLWRPVSGGFSMVAPVADFRAGAIYNGDLYIAGTSSLFRFEGGALKDTWTAGRELPAAPLGSLAVRTGISQSELWVATNGAGISIYDGQHWRQLLPQREQIRRVTALLPLSNGRVLVGTDAGLYASDGSSLRLLHPQFARTHVSALAGDAGAVWVGTRDDGAWLWRGGQATHELEMLPDPAVLSLAAADGRAWIGTALGVKEFVDGQPARTLADGVLARALAMVNGTLWIGTIDQGVLHLTLTTQAPRPNRPQQRRDAGEAVSFAAVGNQLLAVEENSVRDVESGEVVAQAGPNWLSNGHVTAVHADERDRLWVGYFNRGLDLLGATRKHLEDDVLFCVNRIKADPHRGITAVATANGLALFNNDGEVKEVLDRTQGLISNHVTDIAFRRDEMIAATPAGLTMIGSSDVSSLSGFQGLVNNHVYTLADTGDVLYAGTLGGVSAIQNRLVRASFNTADSELRQNWITASAVAGGKLYVGTYGSGVVELHPDGTTTTYEAFAHRRIEINANAMLVTDRAIYAGTAGFGLAVLPQGADRWRFVTTGLPSLNVTAVEWRRGELYVGTDNGLVHAAEALILQ